MRGLIGEPVCCFPVQVTTTLFQMLDTNGDGVIDKFELMDFCSNKINVAKLTKALGIVAIGRMAL